MVIVVFITLWLLLLLINYIIRYTDDPPRHEIETQQLFKVSITITIIIIITGCQHCSVQLLTVERWVRWGGGDDIRSWWLFVASRKDVDHLSGPDNGQELILLPLARLSHLWPPTTTNHGRRDRGLVSNVYNLVHDYVFCNSNWIVCWPFESSGLISFIRIRHNSQSTKRLVYMVRKE